MRATYDNSASNPHNPHNRADLTILRRDYAEKELLQAVRDNPALASAHYVLSSISAARNDVRPAKAALLRTVELEPKNSASPRRSNPILRIQSDNWRLLFCPRGIKARLGLSHYLWEMV